MSIKQLRITKWLNSQTKERPFFSALIVLIMVVVPGYWQLESAVNTADSAAKSANNAAQSASQTATQLAELVKQETARDKANALDNCQTRNTATKNGRDRFDRFFTAIETIFIAGAQTEVEKEQSKQFIENLRTAVPLDPQAEDVDCDDDGQLTPNDYGK